MGKSKTFIFFFFFGFFLQTIKFCFLPQLQCAVSFIFFSFLVIIYLIFSYQGLYLLLHCLNYVFLLLSFIGFVHTPTGICTFFKIFAIAIIYFSNPGISLYIFIYLGKHSSHARTYEHIYHVYEFTYIVICVWVWAAIYLWCMFH